MAKGVPRVLVLFLVPLFVLWAPVEATPGGGVPGLPESGPDIPASPLDVVEVTVFDDEFWSFTEGARQRTIEVPEDWTRAVLVLRIWPEGDPWDRLFAVSVGPMEVLHGTTPRTDMTVEKDITRYGQHLPAGGTADIRLYLGTWVGALRSDLTIRFHIDDPTGVAVQPAQDAVGAFRFHWVGDNDPVTTVTFPETAPSRATVELFTSGHGGEEFWYQSGGWPREFHVLVDNVEVMHVVAMPYTYAFLGFYDPFGSLVHGPMWWTGQQALDKAGVHTGVGEIPPYRVTVLDEEKLATMTGEREVKLVTESTRCCWMTSVGFLLE